MRTESCQWLLPEPWGHPQHPLSLPEPLLTSQHSISAVSPCPSRAADPCLPCSWLGEWDGPWLSHGELLTLSGPWQLYPRVQHFPQAFTGKILRIVESLLQGLHLACLHVCDDTEINVTCQNSMRYAELWRLHLWKAFYMGLVQRNHPSCIFHNLVFAWFPGLPHCLLVMAAPVLAPQVSDSPLFTLLLQTLPMFD